MLFFPPVCATSNASLKVSSVVVSSVLGV